MNHSKTIWKIIFILSIIGCLGCLGSAGWYMYNNWQAEQAYEEIREEENLETLADIENAEFTGERDGEEARLPDGIFLDMENPIDFKKLQDVNKELYAWIRIPNTRIDYPIAQRKGDNGYYLNHDLYGVPRFAGCIFTEDLNKKDFKDPNTVIYGHNMRNQSMFQNLHLFADPDFFEKNQVFYIYTPDKVLAYQIIAAYTTDTAHILGSYDFENEKIFERYLKDIMDVRAMDRNIREDVELTGDDRIVTLSTCKGGHIDARYIVQGVLIEEKDTGSGAKGTKK